MSDMPVSDPKTYSAPGLQAGRGVPDQTLEATNSPGSGKIERRLRQDSSELIKATAKDADSVELANPGRLFQKRPFPGNRLKERNVQVWANDLKGQARESGPAANIDESPLQVRTASKEQALAEMARYALFLTGLPDQVNLGVPFEEQLQVSDQFISLLDFQAKPKGLKELRDSGRQDHRSILECGRDKDKLEIARGGELEARRRFRRMFHVKHS